MTRPRFWEAKSLAEMSAEEWEALCDGCGKCCLHKLEDDDTGEVHYTAVACRLLDLKTIRCTDYENRRRLVADCLRLDSQNTAAFKWLPGTCAYKRVSEGKGLADWHPLISQDPMSVHKAGVSVRGKIISERDAGDLQDHLWPEKD
ncbi:MAG: YcgN family cysteine cluster protein [Alphaproteobacteria bacterium]